ncbi:MAG: hypothetical protein ABIQ61_02315, partial [Ornithinibacter sp.]
APVCSPVVETFGYVMALLLRWWSLELGPRTRVTLAAYGRMPGAHLRGTTSLAATCGVAAALAPGRDVTRTSGSTEDAG